MSLTRQPPESSAGWRVDHSRTGQRPGWPPWVMACLAIWLLLGVCSPCPLAAAEWQPQTCRAQITRVQPMTGIVLWHDHEQADNSVLQLEFAYVRYEDLVRAKGEYNWQPLETLLDEIAERKHQAILRFYFDYVGKPSAVPKWIRELPNYRGVWGKSEGQKTEFADWSHPELQQFALDFYTAFAAKYDRDPRLAFVQTGFGLWSEYHIYSGPMKLGHTFPDSAYQSRFLNHLATTFVETPWMISVDAAKDHTPLAGDASLLQLPFGVFDDSFLCQQHAKVNALDWQALESVRWQRAPAGGEFSYYTQRDQKLALDPKGPHGTRFEDLAARYHLSFIIGSDQPTYQKWPRIKAASQALGYRLRLVRLESNGQETRATFTNEGIAPVYYDTWPAIGDKRAPESLKGLLPGEERLCTIPVGWPTVPGKVPSGDGAEAAAPLKMDCDRLVPGQMIEFNADLVRP